MRAAQGAAQLGAALLVAVVLGCQPGGTGPAAPAGGRAEAPAADPTAAPAASAPAVPPLAPPVPVAVADNLTAAGVGLFVAIEQGYFAEEGLEVTLERVGSAAVAVEALVDHRYVEYALARRGRYVPAEGKRPGR